MPLSRKQLQGKAGAAGFRLIRKWIGGKSAIAAEKTGERLGRWAYRIVRRRRELTLSNLAIAFPEMNGAERRRIAMGVFEHFGRAMCDFVRTDRRSHQEVFDSIVVDGADKLADYLGRGRGMLFVTAHFGNWERMAQFITLNDYRMSVIVRDADDDELNSQMVELRSAAGLHPIARGNAARATLTLLRKNEIVGILPDQNADEAFLPFFGKPCGTVLGPAVLGRRTGAPLCIAFCYRTGPGAYRLRVSEVFDPKEHEEMSNEDIMARFNAHLEAIVREFPDQYLWMHDRWKSARQRGLL